MLKFLLALLLFITAFLTSQAQIIIVPDSSFGSFGAYNTNIKPSILDINSNGQILLGSSNDFNKTITLQLTSNYGIPVSSFGNFGTLNFIESGSYSGNHLNGLKFSNDGSIFMLFGSMMGSPEIPALAKLDKNGKLISTFGNNGVLRLQISINGCLSCIATNGMEIYNNLIYVYGTYSRTLNGIPTTTDIFIRRFNLNCSLP